MTKTMSITNMVKPHPFLVNLITIDKYDKSINELVVFALNPPTPRASIACTTDRLAFHPTMIFNLSK